MEVMTVLHMNSGEGEKSYAKNSSFQRDVLRISIPIKKHAIRKMFESIGGTRENIAIADLGCSSAPDSLWSLFNDLITSVNETRLKTTDQNPPPLGFTFYLNDLPGNDFNTIFKSWPKFQDMMVKDHKKKVDHCFICGVPGSFYGRLFQNQSLHFVHSSYAFHWISKIPFDIKTSNGRNMYISKTSPIHVVDAYYNQFRSDFFKNLRCRSEEIVKGGCMVLTVAGRRSEDRTSKECCTSWDLLAIALNQMVSEGLIEEDMMNSFNVPIYYPSAKEVEGIVKDEGSFTIDCMEVFEVDWDPNAPQHQNGNGKVKTTKGNHTNGNHTNGNHTNGNHTNGNHEKLPLSNGEKVIPFVSSMRAVAEPLLVDHFGEAIIEEAFTRYNHIVIDEMAKERKAFVNVIVSLFKM